METPVTNGPRDCGICPHVQGKLKHWRCLQGIFGKLHACYIAGMYKFLRFDGAIETIFLGTALLFTAPFVSDSAIAVAFVMGGIGLVGLGRYLYIKERRASENDD